jgi:hypothetical protein
MVRRAMVEAAVRPVMAEAMVGIAEDRTAHRVTVAAILRAEAALIRVGAEGTPAEVTGRSSKAS